MTIFPNHFFLGGDTLIKKLIIKFLHKVVRLFFCFLISYVNTSYLRIVQMNNSTIASDSITVQCLGGGIQLVLTQKINGAKL